MINISIIIGGDFQTNCYILEKDKKVVIIDFVPEVEEIIKKNNFEIEKLLLTHIHFDHITGLGDFQERYSFELVMSKKALKNINDPLYNLTTFIPPEFKKNFKNIKLDKAMAFENNKIINTFVGKIKPIETPGHTDDSAVYIIQQNKMVFTGDTIFKNSIGRTDLPGGDFETLIKSIFNLFKELDDDFIIYPGHGEPTTIKEEKTNNPFLQDR